MVRIYPDDVQARLDKIDDKIAELYREKAELISRSDKAYYVKSKEELNDIIQALQDGKIYIKNSCEEVN